MRESRFRSLRGVANRLGPLALVATVAVTTVLVPREVLSVNRRRSVQVDHAGWDRVLKRYVDEEGRVAYARLAAEGRGELDRYLDQLANADPERMTGPDQLAFWINAYNAGIVAAILRGYSPESALSRVRLFRWYKFRVAGRNRTPHEIEHEILRRRFHEPRIHFALVCATTSCPKLRREAYRGDKLDRQLDDQARRFINDPHRNRIDTATGVVELSRIFEWFATDFSASAGSVTDFVAGYVESTAKADLVRKQRDQLQFLNYEWTLNART